MLSGVLGGLRWSWEGPLFGLNELFNASLGPENWLVGAVGDLLPPAGGASPGHFSHGHLGILAQGRVVCTFVVPSSGLALLIDEPAAFGFDQGVAITPGATDWLVHGWFSVVSWPLLLR